jgi:hypothetical protein
LLRVEVGVVAEAILVAAVLVVVLAALELAQDYL